MSTDDDAPSEAQTDWLANSIFGYGFGFTKEQALQEMARHTHPNDADTVTVDLVEHTGSASVGMGGWEVEEYVGGERVEIDADAMKQLSAAAIEAAGLAERALEDADRDEPAGLDHLH